MESYLVQRVAVIVVLVLSALFVNGGWEDVQKMWPHAAEKNACEEGKLCVVFFDVGQGDATYIQSPSGTQVLIDGGRDASVLRHLGAHLGFSDRDIDMVIATHPDSDHIGGLIDVMERYEVERIVRTNNNHETPTTDVFDDKEEDEGAEIIIARRGQNFDLGDGASLEVLFPDRDVSDIESNTSSIIVKLTYGDHEFLLTGDSPKNIEEYLVVTDGAHLQSDVLKIGHHGSRTSSSKLFLDEVAPSFGVISAAADNSYGHPHVEVTDALFNKQIEILETANEGNITFVSNGVSLELK